MSKNEKTFSINRSAIFNQFSNFDMYCISDCLGTCIDFKHYLTQKRSKWVQCNGAVFRCAHKSAWLVLQCVRYVLSADSSEWWLCSLIASLQWSQPYLCTLLSLCEWEGTPKHVQCSHHRFCLWHDPLIDKKWFHMFLHVIRQNLVNFKNQAK